MTTSLSRKMAHLASISYLASSRCKSIKYYDAINDSIQFENIVFDRLRSTCNVLVFYNKKNRDLYIVHRGTDTNGKYCGADILANIHIIFGNIKGCINLKNRSETTEKVIRYYKKRRMVRRIYGSGHSLGGTTLYKTLFINPYVRKNIRRTYHFNEVYTSKHSKKTSKEIKKRISNIAVHYRTKCDIISKFMEFSKPIGKVVTIKKIITFDS